MYFKNAFQKNIIFQKKNVKNLKHETAIMKTCVSKMWNMKKI